ncbi:hypothetical protein GY45DRAFT_1431986 [Cubamyces sp. BRFM 1775]|nr:hypothetical protein GY45DRAFT_1431986 [Cubamyces sp. BRFM 1775]
MQTINLFTNTIAAGGSATTAAALLSRLTGATATYHSRRKAHATEWDPSGDEIVEATECGRWGAVGGERRRAQRTFVHQWPPLLAKKAPNPVPIPSYPWTDPKWNPAPPKRRDWKEEQFRLTEACNPFNPMNVALRAAGDTKLKREMRGVPRDQDEWDELTEACNPFNPVNVAARAAAEAHVEATGRQPEPFESLSLVMGGLSVCMEEPAPELVAQSRARALADVQSTKATSFAKLAAPTPAVESRTPSPQVWGASASPVSDGHSDTTSSSWPTLASISPPQPLHRALQPDSAIDEANLAATEKEQVAASANSPSDEDLGEFEAPSFMDLTFLNEV